MQSVDFDGAETEQLLGGDSVRISESKLTTPVIRRISSDVREARRREALRDASVYTATRSVSRSSVFVPTTGSASGRGMS